MLEVGTKLKHFKYGEGVIVKITPRINAYGNADIPIYTIDFGKVVDTRTVNYHVVNLTTLDFLESDIKDPYFID